VTADVVRRDSCRLCDGRDLELVLHVAACPPVDAYVTADLLSTAQASFPLDLFLCLGCGHAQLLDVVSPAILFGSYIYTTSSSPGLVDYFGSYVDDVMAFIGNGLRPGDCAIDVGSNDGTLLRLLESRGLTVMGIDPAAEIAQAATASGVETLASFFTNKVAESLEQRGRCALVTANNVFAHADSLGDMADGARTLLAHDGVFVFEVSYLVDMIDNLVFDFIYHEHLSHHSVKPLRSFLTRHGLELLHVQRTPSKGGSIRCFAQLIGGPRAVAGSVDQLIDLEAERGMAQASTFGVFAARIDAARAELGALLAPRIARGETVAGYGASATATVFLYHFDLGPSLQFIVDDNPVRQGRFSPGHHLPVLPAAALLQRAPNVVIVLAWRFADMIIAKNRAFLDQGGAFVVPLPVLRVVDAASSIPDG
jgi:SAM-dependent methyltransferase